MLKHDYSKGSGLFATFFWSFSQSFDTLTSNLVPNSFNIRQFGGNLCPPHLNPRHIQEWLDSGSAQTLTELNQISLTGNSAFDFLIYEAPKLEGKKPKNSVKLPNILKDKFTVLAIHLLEEWR